MKRSNNMSNKKPSRKERYITKLAQDLRAFRERELAGEKISAKERRNMRARERRVMNKMKSDANVLLQEANRVMNMLIQNDINTLSLQRVKDELYSEGRGSFSFDGSKTYEDIVAEITRARTFLNSPDTNVLTGKRQQRNEQLRKKYGDKVQALSNNTYLQSGLIATEEEAKQIFANYRRIEEFHMPRIGKQGQKGVYGSENLILYMIDVHNMGLDELKYGEQAILDFNLEQLPEFQEMLNERNKVTGISGLFQKGGYYGRLEGLL